jgi:signal peptidase I
VRTKALKSTPAPKKSKKSIVKSLPKIGKNYVVNKITEFDYAEFFRSLLWAIIIALIFRTMLFEPFKIPSGSMMPNLLVGDYLFASKYSYGYSKHSLPFSIPIFNGRVMFDEPERGDIIVFKGVKDPQIHYIKRLIGLPGDTVQVKRGTLYINDKEIERWQIGNYTRIGSYGEHINHSEYVELLPNGIQYKVLDANLNNHREFPDETIKYQVPAGHYFFMGDNRNHSVDSRFLNQMGFVPEENLVGKAVFMFWTEDFSIQKFLTEFKTGRAFKVIENEN